MEGRRSDRNSNSNERVCIVCMVKVNVTTVSVVGPSPVNVLLPLVTVTAEGKYLPRGISFKVVRWLSFTLHTHSSIYYYLLLVE